MRIYIADAPNPKHPWEKWEVIGSCGVCGPGRYVTVPIHSSLLPPGRNPLTLACAWLKSQGWQIKPTRCPEHARVVA